MVHKIERRGIFIKMIIKKEEFEEIRKSLINLYFIARDYGDGYVMETADSILSMLAVIESKDIKKRQSLK